MAVEFLRKFKQNRLLTEYQERLRITFRVLFQIVSDLEIPFEGIFPKPSQFALLQAVRDIVDNPNNGVITLASFDKLKVDLPGMVNIWKTEATAALITVINDSVSFDIPLDSDLSKLAIGLFFCCEKPECPLWSCPRTYPAILRDGCKEVKFTSDPTDIYTTTVGQFYADSGCHQYPKWFFQVLKRIIEVCGYNPRVATVQNMDELDIRLVCADTTCSSEEHIQGVDTLYTWRSAVRTFIWTIVGY